MLEAPVHEAVAPVTSDRTLIRQADLLIDAVMAQAVLQAAQLQIARDGLEHATWRHIGPHRAAQLRERLRNRMQAVLWMVQLGGGAGEGA
jgi:hypothetical protein